MFTNDNDAAELLDSDALDVMDDALASGILDPEDDADLRSFEALDATTADDDDMFDMLNEFEDWFEEE